MKHIIRLFKEAKQWALHLTISTIGLFIITGINLLSPIITKQIISIMETGNYENSLQKITNLSLILLGCFAIRAFFQFLSNYLSHVASWRLVNRIRCMLYDHFQKLSMGYYHNKQTGQLMSRVVNDTSTFESLIAHAIPDLATNIMTLLGVLLILMSISPKLTLLVCIPLPFIAILSFVLRKIRRYFKKAKRKSRSSTQYCRTIFPV